MRIVHFGTYSVGEGYPRNSVVAGGLSRAGAEVIECHRDVWRGPGDKVRGVTSSWAAISAIFRFFRAWAGLTWEYLFNCPPHDLVIVGYSGHLDVFLARALAFLKGKPVVLDAFLSLYEAVIEDRKLAQPSSLRACVLRLIDRASSKAAKLVLLDTNEHIKYYDEILGVSDDRFVRVFVGGEEESFYPRSITKQGGPAEILFFGSFLPLHGADVIVNAIRLLEKEKSIHFTLVGDGPEWENCHSLASGIAEDFLTWERLWVSYDDLSSKIANADICLGIFGASGKTSRVIPCKVFNILAMGRPLITADTAAAREALVNGENAYLVPPGDPEALANAILTLNNNPELMRKLAAEGLKTYRQKFSMEAIGKELYDELNRQFGPFSDDKK